MSESSHDRPVSGLAITSLVLGILTLLMFWVPILHLAPGLLAILLGIIGLRKTRRGTAGGGGMAAAGILCALLGMIPTFMIVLGIVGIVGSDADLEQFGELEQFEQPRRYDQEGPPGVISRSTRNEFGKNTEAEDPKTRLQQPRQHGGYFAFAFSPDGESVAGGTGVVKQSGRAIGGGQVLLWNSKTGELIETLGDHGESVTWLAFSGNGTTLASASKDNGVVKLWNLESRKAGRTIQLPGSYATNNGSFPFLILSPDGGTLVTVLEKSTEVGTHTVKEAGEMTAWDLQTGRAKWSVPDSHLKAITLSRDAKTLVGYVRKVEWTQDKDGARGTTLESQVAFWDVETGDVVRTMEAERFAPRAIVVLPDGKTLAGLDTQQITLFDTQTGEMQEGAKWKRDRWAFNAFAFSRDGKLVARAATEWVDLMDVQTGKVVENLTTEFPDGWWDPTFSSDLKLLACKHQHDPSIIEMPWPAQTSPPGEAAEIESVATAEGQPKVQADDRPEADAEKESRSAMETVRTWTDRTGKFTVEAEFVDFVDGKVQLAKLNGRTTTVPIERLSTEDQQWIKDRITSNE